ncbi:uncharacterized protein LOC143618309 [Bidens hawaiensis]|uniref:uncharacterized protein LOC143618309 n=1 Tax=Bidens hawaiensis TaxID=980011 RepID=UPI00404AAA5C
MSNEIDPASQEYNFITKKVDKKKKSEKLSELLRKSELLEEQEEELKQAVRRLQYDDVLGGAKDVRRLTKENADVRTTLALLGAIPPLVGMLDSGDFDFQIAGLYALLNIGIANDTNKAAIVKAGAVHKMLDLVKSQDEGEVNQDVCAAIVANFLGLTALDSNKPIIGSSGAILYLVNTFKNSVNCEVNSLVVQDCLRALYNLSLLGSNVSLMIEIDGFVKFLLIKLGDMEVSDRILSVLSNVVSTPEGRKAVSSVHDLFQILVDVLSWSDSPECQEQVTYILMVMAHKSYRDRVLMIESRVKSSVLELTLLGSTLAQKRASRILEILSNDKEKQVSEAFVGSVGANVSAPLYLVNDSDMMMSDESKAVKNLVQQSLHSNMRRIAKRANLPQDFVPTQHFRSLTSISTSKSLPF